MKVIKIGTRKSKLALIQANWVKSLLEKITNNIKYEIVYITTKGDRFLNTELYKLNGTGFFTKEVEKYLLQKEIDIAVHSMKDLPTDIADGLEIAAVPVREKINDVFVSMEGKLNDLKRGAKIATSSLRRIAQIKRIKKDIEIFDIRGNIDTRIKKVRNREVDGLILAFAGLKRLGFENMITEVFPPDVILPAVGQGALAIEIRKGEQDLYNLLRKINDDASELSVISERSFLRSFGVGCKTPLGAYAEIASDFIRLKGAVFNIDGSKAIVKELTDSLNNAEKLGKRLADSVIQEGGLDLIYNG